VLYLDEDEAGQGTQQLNQDTMQAHNNGHQAQHTEDEEAIEIIHLKTYKFKTPQFIVRQSVMISVEKADGDLFQKEPEGGKAEDIEAGDDQEPIGC
jgi:hypothetical protein